MSKFSPDHMGRPTPNSDPTAALSQSHGLNADKPYRGSAPNIARDGGRGKAVYGIRPHGSSTARQIAGAGKGGVGHASGGQPIATTAVAVPHAYGSGIPKAAAGKSVPIIPGMRSRTKAAHSGTDLQTLGRCIMDEAVRIK